MDRLADDGVRFDSAYTACPICVPARAALMTGRYVHDSGVWDNGAPIPGHIPSIGSYLEAAGYDTVVCGRTHFVGPDRLHGFGRRIFDDTEHWKHLGLPGQRRDPEQRRGSDSHVSECGIGEGFQNDYDRTACSLAERFLEGRATGGDDHPFLLYVGFMNPHFPLVVPEEFAGRYDPESMPLPATVDQPLDEQHPDVRQRRFWLRNERADHELYRRARACYYGLVSFTDHLVGRVVDAVDRSGLAEDTIVIYASDHGEMGGHHGFWQKQCFYEQAVRVPLIVRGPGIGRRETRSDPVSLVDLTPTFLDAAEAASDPLLPGRSLLSPPDPDRTVFSEYHALGSTDASFMLRRGRFKYIYHVNDRPELFDLDADPDEVRDLAADSSHRGVLDGFETELRAILDPEETDRRAKASQASSGPARGYADRSPRWSRPAGDDPYRGRQ